MSLGTSMKVMKVARKFKDAKVSVDEQTQKEQSEFGGDPISLLSVEREAPIGEEVRELGDYFSMRAEMRKNPGGFRPPTVSSKDVMGMMLNKPSTAFAKAQSGAFSLKKGSTWKTLKKGVRGEIDVAAAAASSDGESGGERPSSSSSVSSVGAIMKQQSINKLTSGISGLKSLKAVSGITKSVSVMRGRSREYTKRLAGGASSLSPPKPANTDIPSTPSALRGKSAEPAALTRSGRSISFDVEDGVEEEHKRRQDERASTPSGGERASTAPTKMGDGGKGISRGQTDDLLEQIHTAHADFDAVRAGKSKGAIDMDAFKEAFHESSADKKKLEEERIKEEAEKVRRDPPPPPPPPHNQHHS
jgi:hypothetical protein